MAHNDDLKYLCIYTPGLFGDKINDDTVIKYITIVEIVNSIIKVSGLELKEEDTYEEKQSAIYKKICLNSNHSIFVGEGDGFTRKKSIHWDEINWEKVIK